MSPKKLLALLMALLTIVGAVAFNASAENSTEAITVDFCEDLASAPVVTTDVNYIASIPGAEYWRTDAGVRFTTGKVDGYYTLTAKNENDLATEGEIRIELTNAEGDEFGFISLKAGEETSDCVRLPANTEYYISMINLWEGKAGALSFNLTCAPDPEPNEKKGKIRVLSGEFYEGNLANAEDEDWVCLGNYDTKKYRLLLESRTEGLEVQAMVYTYAQYKDTFELTHGETADAVVIPAPAENEYYYVRVAGIAESYGNYALRLEELATVTPENDRTFNSVKYMPTFTNSEYDRTYVDADPVIFGRTCVCDIPESTSAVNYRCVKISTETLQGDFEILLKNQGVPTEGDLLAVQVRKSSRKSDEILVDTTLEMGEEQSFSVSFTRNSFYYICFYTLDEVARPGGYVNFKVSQVIEPEETTTAAETTEVTEATETTVAEITERTTDVITTEATEATTEITLPSEAVTTVTTEPESESLEVTEVTEITTEASTETTAPKEQFMLGDPDLSGKINIKDATLIQKAIAKLTALDDNRSKVADVTADSKVNIKDATAIQKYIAKIETPYNIGGYIL